MLRRKLFNSFSMLLLIKVNIDLQPENNVFFFILTLIFIFIEIN